MARFKEFAMRLKCPSNVPAEIFFNLAREVAGDGQTSRYSFVRDRLNKTFSISMPHSLFGAKDVCYIEKKVGT
jgi:hypothetical protein|tara:strand:- start:397 stop:615 length:219 start_codon:yes stop_codon:yes gene_type:complete